ncbi:MAG: hypothetical protein ACT4OK_03015 [Gemmobacter sp.]
MTPPSTLILGSAKSGTTALFYAIRAAMNRATGHDLKGLFEPRDMPAFRRYFDTSGDAVFLCKALLGPVMRNMKPALDRFDRRIVIYRDPRDNIVSRLLFMPPRLLVEADRSKCNDFLDLLRQKQADPGSLSVLGILRALERLSGRTDLARNFRDNAVMPAHIQRTYGDRFWMFAYEDLVEGRFAHLSEYLGFEVTPEFELGGQHGHVSRSKTTGEWRQWFLDEDIAYFAQDVAEDYALMGFDPAEAADPAPAISPETSSDYAQKLVDRLLEKNRVSRLKRRASARSVAGAAAEQGAALPGKAGKGTAPVGDDDLSDDDVPRDTSAADARRARRQKRVAVKD